MQCCWRENGLGNENEKNSGPEYRLQQSTSSFPRLREPQDVWTPGGSGEE